MCSNVSLRFFSRYTVHRNFVSSSSCTRCFTLQINCKLSGYELIHIGISSKARRHHVVALSDRNVARTRAQTLERRLVSLYPAHQNFISIEPSCILDFSAIANIAISDSMYIQYRSRHWPDNKKRLRALLDVGMISL